MDIKRVATDAINETIVTYVPHMDYKGQVAKRINENAFKPLEAQRNVQKLVEKQYGAQRKNKKKLIEVDLVQQISFNQKD
jgi:trigger factor